MNVFKFVKRLFRGETPAPVDRFRKLRPLTGNPDEYERWEEDSTHGITAAFFNPSNELYDFLNLYQIHPWIFAAVNAIATAAAGVPYRIKKAEGEEVKKGELVNVFARPNPHQVWFEFMETIKTYLELTGNAFIEEVRDNNGVLMAMYPLRPDKMKILPHPKVKIAGYIYEPRPGHEILYSANEITHIKYLSSIDEYWGISPAYAAQNSIILDMNATTYNKKFFQNSAVPEGVLQTEGSLSDQTYQRLKRDWAKRHQGNNNAFNFAVLEEGLQYKPIGFNQRDMMMVEMKEMSREDVLACYRVPPAIVGVLKHAAYSSLREQRKMFYTDKVLPGLERDRQVINEHLMPDGYELEWITDGVIPLIEDVQVATQVSMSLVSHGIQTINEVRKNFFAMKPVKWGDRPWMPVGLAQWDPNPETSVHPETPKPTQMTQPQRLSSQTATQAQNQKTPMGGSMPDPDKKAVGKMVEFEKMIAPEPDWNNSKAVRSWQVWNLWKGLATPDYIGFKKFFKDYFSAQFDRAVPVLRANYKADKSKAKKGLSIISKMLTEEYTDAYRIAKDSSDDEAMEIILKIDFDDKKNKVKLKKISEATVKKHGLFTLGQIGVNVPFDTGNPRVEEFLKKQAGKQIDWIDNRTRKLLGRELAKSIRQGEDFEDMMTRVQRVLKGDLAEDRIRKIARTETVTLTQWSKLEAAMQSGVVKKKRWVASLIPGPDGTRDSHADIHDVEVGLDEKFPVMSRSGPNYMFGPGDPNADPENIVNCLCVLDFPGSTPELETLEGDVLDERKRDDSDDGNIVIKLKQSPVDISPLTGEMKDLARAIRKGQEAGTEAIKNLAETMGKGQETGAEAIRSLAETMEGVAKRDPIKVVLKPSIETNPNIIMPEPKEPIQKKEAPIIVNVSPKLEATLKMPKRKRTMTAHKDSTTGRVIGSTEIEETIEDDPADNDKR